MNIFTGVMSGTVICHFLSRLLFFYFSRTKFKLFKIMIFIIKAIRCCCCFIRDFKFLNYFTDLLNVDKRANFSCIMNNGSFDGVWDFFYFF